MPELSQPLNEQSLEQGTMELSPEEGRQALLAVPGLGPWSVDVYYLRALGTPDVWPFGDLALADAMARVKRLDSLPSREEQARISAAWSPWRAAGHLITTTFPEGAHE